METYSVLMVEDEQEAADTLRAALVRYGEERRVSFQVRWARSAAELDDARGADVIFMDIELPGQNGMDAALELRKRDQTTPLVFVTNLAQYAVRGYQAQALDFIVKPFTYYDFALRMDRAMQAMRRNVARTITVRNREGVRVFSARDLVYVELEGHDLVYHLADGSTARCRGSISAAEKALGGSPFLKVSSGCIVSMAHVRGVCDAAVTLSTGDVAWISRANKRRCLEAIANYLGGDA